MMTRAEEKKAGQKDVAHAQQRAATIEDPVSEAWILEEAIIDVGDGSPDHGGRCLPNQIDDAKTPVPANGHSLLVLRRNRDGSFGLDRLQRLFENVLVRDGQDQEAWERNQKCKQDGPIIEKRQLEFGVANDKRVRQPGADQKRKEGERDRNGIEPEKRKRASATAAIQAAEESVCGREGGGIEWVNRRVDRRWVGSRHMNQHPPPDDGVAPPPCRIGWTAPPH
jgi:hypothetical protein